MMCNNKIPGREFPNSLAAGDSIPPEDTRQATRHNTEAAKHHEEAAKHHENGDHAKAVESADKAHTHHSLAAKHKRADRIKKAN